MSASEHQLEHRTADAAPAPAPVLVFNQPEQVEEPFAMAGLAVADPIRRSSADPLGGSSVDSKIEGALRSPSGGSKLDGNVKSSMESTFGTDLSDVRVHTGSDASKMSKDMQATAFTHGSNIYFSQGTYNPSSESGQHLIAHELSHVVQRKQGRDTGGAGGGTTIGKANDPLEAEADKMATSVVGALRRQSKGCCDSHSPAA